MLETWFAAYPSQHREQLRRRFVADDFDSAFFELLLHALLQRVRYTVEVEPPLPTGVRPDFRASSVASQFLLEAAVVTDQSRDERKRERQHNMVYDAIDDLASTDYFFDLIKVDLKGHQQPSGNRIREFLAQKSAESDYEDMCKRAENDTLPRWEFEDEKALIVIRPIPKHEARGNPDVRPIGMYPTKTRWGGTKVAVRKRLGEKAKKFKGDNGPLILAVNVLSPWGFDWDDAVEVLFGTVRRMVDVDTREWTTSRARDGFLYGPNEPRNTRVSAVLLTSILPWSIARSRVDLVHNPRATYPIPGIDLPVDSITLVDEKLERQPGPPLWQLFDLPSDWPGDRSSEAG